MIVSKTGVHRQSELLRLADGDAAGQIGWIRSCLAAGSMMYLDHDTVKEA
jgi:hypothetical protein